ncbi:MAG: Trk family potassium uptake protein [Tissierellia bacterium]|nr:Trk family potassium uptake protein [Tissierellia bacterium]
MTAFNRKSNKSHLSPPLFLLLGFALVIMVGTFLLNLPMSSQNGEPVGLVNAFFTASSATCVTGLTVVDTAAHWTDFGHVVIITMIQIGGLGLMTFSVLFSILLGKSIGLSDRLIIKEQFNLDTLNGLVKLLKYVVLIAFVIEGIGSLIFATKFIPMYGFGRGLWTSIFHGISSFCNAGFSTIPGNIEPFKSDLLININIMLLVIFGGLGFSVIVEIFSKRKFSKLSVQAKLVLIISTALILIGAIGFFLMERTNMETIGGEGLYTQTLQSFFQSVVARTAGFNSVNLAGLRDSTALLLVIMMFVGGSPGSTAGGLKTTTVATLFLATFSVIRGEKDTVVFNRKIADETIRKSLAIIVIAISLIIMITLILSITEDFSYIDILYETVSAYGTVGVTKGITPELSNIGKIILSCTMYIGRVGSLTMAFAFGRKLKLTKLSYAETNISVG